MYDEFVMMLLCCANFVEKKDSNYCNIGINALALSRRQIRTLENSRFPAEIITPKLEILPSFRYHIIPDCFLLPINFDLGQ